MARNPRPIDPSEGPLQAFAVELRRVRELAGDPTYRAMSVRAGFSATTLSEAAGGVRKPSLDVTLAFVGVCGGDPGEWRERWIRLDRALAEQGSSAEAGEAEPAAGPDPAPAPDPHEAAAGAGAGSGAERSDSEPVADVDVRDDRGAELGGAAGTGAASAGAGMDTIGGAPRWKRWVGLSGTKRLRATRGAAVLAAAVLLIAAAMVLPGLDRAGGSSPTAVVRASSSGPAGCPHAAGGAAFRGETYVQGTNERSGARLDSMVVATLPAQCMLSFSGYCIGQSLRDQKSGSPDMRWFKLFDGSGVVASAIVHGNPPSNLAPTPCAEDVPPPSVVRLRLAAASGSRHAETLSATGVNAPIVGYAAYYSDQRETETQAPYWHELALNDLSYQPEPKWDLDGVRAPITGLSGVPSGTVPVVAVACLGGGAPTQVVDALAMSPAHPATTGSVQLTRQDLASAERAACQYP